MIFGYSRSLPTIPAISPIHHTSGLWSSSIQVILPEKNASVSTHYPSRRCIFHVVPRFHMGTQELERGFRQPLAQWLSNLGWRDEIHLGTEYKSRCLSIPDILYYYLPGWGPGIYSLKHSPSHSCDSKQVLFGNHWSDKSLSVSLSLSVCLSLIYRATDRTQGLVHAD
jgi:hypothetical protein